MLDCRQPVLLEAQARSSQDARPTSKAGRTDVGEKDFVNPGAAAISVIAGQSQRSCNWTRRNAPDGMNSLFFKIS